MACLVAVYGAEPGRGTCALIEPLLMMRPPFGVWSRIIRNAALATRNAPLRLTSTTVRHWSQVNSPKLVLGTLPPALLNSTSSLAEFVPGLRKQVGDGCRIGHVRGHRESVAGMFAGQSSGLFEGVAPPPGEHHRVAFREQRKRCGPPNAAAGAGDQRNHIPAAHRFAPPPRIVWQKAGVPACRGCV